MRKSVLSFKGGKGGLHIKKRTATHLVKKKSGECKGGIDVQM